MLRRVLNLVFSRIVVTGVLLLLQAFWLFALFYWLADYAKWFGGVGVAMSIIMCLALIRQDSTVPEFKISWMILFAVMPVQGGILYLLCAALRLARFNCMASAPRKEGQSSDFVGLPVPMAAGAVVSTMYLVMYLAGRAPDGAMDLGVFKYVIALAMAGVSVLMMSRVVYPSFKHINMRTRGTMYAIVLIVLTVICIFKFPWVMPAVIFSIYLLYGLVRPWVARRWRNKLEASDGEEE